MESIRDSPSEIPVQVLNELDNLQEIIHFITAPPTSVEDILNDLLKLDDIFDLPVTEPDSIEDLHQDPLDVLDVLASSVSPLSVASPISPLSVASQVDENWNVLEYTQYEEDGVQAKQTGKCGQNSQVDDHMNDFEHTKRGAGYPSNNVNRNVGKHDMRAQQLAQSELVSQLENMNTLGYTDCDVYSSSNGIIRYFGINKVHQQAQEYQAAELPQQYIVVCSRADDTPKYECNVCMKPFRLKWRFEAHMKLHIAPRRHECNVCRKSFVKKKSLDEHLNVHTGTKPYECEICKVTFHRRGSLNKHFQTHFDATRYECDVCNRAFSSKWNLKDHSKVHSGSRPYECKVCEKSFRQKKCLSVHSKIH